ncbi:MAG: potassium-transporting ATPase subunit KdpC [Verrucomicrobia bacterium]|nr:potassium-transporting ATPase subunit KdpC [Verrucomicrobiota bacterium]
MFLVALRLFVLLTLLTGVLYPLLVTGLGALIASPQARGSLVRRSGQAVGSALLAQEFKDPRNFCSRPSAADPAFATVPSGASNLGPTSAKLREAVEARDAAFRARTGAAATPADLLTASGSGLDPHLSPAAVRAQLVAVAQARGFDAAQREALAALIERSIEPPQFGLLGEPRINILQLNLALDALSPRP